MKKRVIAFLVCIFSILGMVSPQAYAVYESESMQAQVNVIAHVNYFAEDGVLASENTWSEKEIACLVLCEDSIDVSGEINSEKSYHINVQIVNGKFDSAIDLNNNYKVLSVLSSDNTVYIIMKTLNKNSIFFIEINTEKYALVSAYGLNWYQDFVMSEIEEGPSPYTITSTQKTFTRTTNVLGNVYKENLVIVFSNDWDNPVYTNAGFTMTCQMKLESQTTDVKMQGSSNYIEEEGCSLFVNQVIFSAATPKGEYFRKIDTEFYGDIFRPATVELGISLGIPNTPLSVSWTSLSKSKQESIGSGSAYFDLSTVSGDGVPMGIRAKFDDPNLSLRTAENVATSGQMGDMVTVESTLKTHDDYINLGRKGFSYKWDFYVVSSGECLGTYVEPYNAPGSFSNTLYYTLKQP